MDNNRYIFVENGHKIKEKRSLLYNDNYIKVITTKEIREFFLSNIYKFNEKELFSDMISFENNDIEFVIWLNSEDDYYGSELKKKISLSEYKSRIILIELIVKDSLDSKYLELIYRLINSYDFDIYSKNHKKILKYNEFVVFQSSNKN